VDTKAIETLEKLGRESADRREFLKKAGKAAATLPAVALLLSANATPAEAFNRYGRGGRGKPGRHGHGRRRAHKLAARHGHGGHRRRGKH
jgi:hypothetical protein